MTHHFVQLQLGNQTFQPSQVSTKECFFVDDFKNAIKSKFSQKLQAFESHELRLFEPDGMTEIAPQTLMVELKIDLWKPLVVKVQEPPAPVRTGSSRKQRSYKGLGVEASCSKYLDAIAKQLSLYYRFAWAQGRYPTFGDVLYAYQKNDWGHQFRYQADDEIGEPVPMLSIPLPDLFGKDEWTKLDEWHQMTYHTIHNGSLLRTSTGKRLVIVPHADYNQETISFFQRVGVKGHLYEEESYLVVQDEAELS